jgi:hypothetical protein
MENPRTETARDNDDSAMIENLEPAPADSTSAGGNIAQDIATENELAQLSEPAATTRPRKDHAIEHAQERRPDRARAPDTGS